VRIVVLTTSTFVLPVTEMLHGQRGKNSVKILLGIVPLAKRRLQSTFMKQLYVLVVCTDLAEIINLYLPHTIQDGMK
jgi:hypothetical protein